MTTRVSLVITVPDRRADDVAALLRTVFDRAPAMAGRWRVAREPLSPDGEADLVSRTMLARPFESSP